MDGTFHLTKRYRNLAWLVDCHVKAQLFKRCIKGQHAAIIVDTHGRCIATGYNGAPRGMKNCTDGGCPRATSDVPSGSSYDTGPGFCVATHAEANALIHATFSDMQGATMYVNGAPCMGCARLVANSGIKRLVYSEAEIAEKRTIIQFLVDAGVTPLEVAMRDIYWYAEECGIQLEQ